jgi:hypothetical protein
MITYFVLWCYLLIQGMALNTGVLPFSKRRGATPKWETFVKPLIAPNGKKELHFHNAQAASRKDVERAFGILQA